MRPSGRFQNFSDGPIYGRKSRLDRFFGRLILPETALEIFRSHQPVELQSRTGDASIFFLPQQSHNLLQPVPLHCHERDSSSDGFSLIPPDTENSGQVTFLHLGASSSNLHSHHLRWWAVSRNPHSWPVGVLVYRQIADLVRRRHEVLRRLSGAHINTENSAAIEVVRPDELVLIVHGGSVGRRKGHSYYRIAPRCRSLQIAPDWTLNWCILSTTGKRFPSSLICEGETHGFETN